MKRACWILFTLLFLSLESCNSDFNINAPRQDVYVLNCIVRSDTSVQYALISKNYFTENGTIPPPNSIDQNIKGATIRIYYNDSVFVMRDTTVQLLNSGSTAVVDCYYVKNLILSANKVIRIQAAVPGGDTLISTIQIPQISYPKTSWTFPQADPPPLPTEPFLPNQGSYSTRPSYDWSWEGTAPGGTSIMSLPRLEVYYKHYEQGASVTKKALVPLAFYFASDGNGNLLPVNVDLSFRTSCITLLETVNKAMQDISGDDPNKENYAITNVVFSVMCLDPALSRYYSAYNTYSTDFTVKLRQTDFSNIVGGKGIFGACYKFAKPLTVDSLYIRSFGYRYQPF
jgi:hypothetical protein